MNGMMINYNGLSTVNNALISGMGVCPFQVMLIFLTLGRDPFYSSFIGEGIVINEYHSISDVAISVKSKIL